jgi:hypothetical protein
VNRQIRQQNQTVFNFSNWGAETGGASCHRQSFQRNAGAESREFFHCLNFDSKQDEFRIGWEHSICLGRLYVGGGNKGCPGHSRFRLILDCPSRNRWNPKEFIAAGTLNLLAGKLFVTGQMLFAMWTLKFEFAHDDLIMTFRDFIKLFLEVSEIRSSLFPAG